MSASEPDMPGEGPVWPPADAEAVDVHDVYDRLADTGTAYGPAFQGLRRVWRRRNEVFGEVRLPDGEPATGGFGIHPALFDSALQAWAVLGGEAAGRPFSFTGVRLSPSAAVDLRVWLRPAGPDAVALTATDPDGRPVVTVGSLVFRKAPDADRYRDGLTRNALFSVAWTAVTTTASAAPRAERPAADTCMVITGPDGYDPAAPAEATRTATVEVLRRIQDHLRSSRRGAGPLAVVTRGAVSTSPEDPPPDLVGAAVRGLARAAQAEHPGRIVLVDLEHGAASQRMVDAAVDSGEPEVAVRAGTVYAPRLVSAAPRADDPADPRPFRTEGTVLIVGGTGALGSRVARRLATEHGVRHLLLTRGSRDPYGTGGPGDAERGGLGDLEADVTVTVADCDPADGDALRTLVSQAQPPVSAVVLGDGGPETGAFRETPAGSLGPDQLTAALRTRAEPAVVLHELTRDLGLDLDAFVLCSAAVSVLGGAGRADHAAADAFLDALAAQRAGAGLPGLSIAWGPITGRTRPEGAADDHPHTAGDLVEVSEEHTGALLDAALRCAGAPTVVAAPVDTASLRRRREQVPALLRGLVPARAPAADGANQTADASLADRLTSLAPAERDRVLLGAVRDRVAAVLGHVSRDPVGPDTPFKELGVDSVTAVELRGRLNAMTGLRLPATVVFDCPTARDLARRISDELLPASGPGGAATVSPRLRSAGAPAAEPIAIVGMACRLPGGIRSPEDLWELLLRGDDVIGEFPHDRGWDVDSLFDPDPDAAGRSYVRHGGFLQDAADFDAGLFGVNPREALAMDPQQRLLLQAAWEAFERAGIDPTGMRGSRTGVFVGLGYHDYGGHWADAPAELGGYLGNGISGSIASGRIAYTFGLEGPAVTVDTACSSSLVSLHQAVQSLRLGECDMALAGGATVMSTPGEIVELCRQRGLSPDGRCKAFGADADGFGIAEGIGLLLVEPLSRAHREGHQVLAVVRGSAVGQDGRSNGLTAPSGAAQRRVIQDALAAGGLGARDIDAVEAHGTGTALGDPIEARELLATYGQDRSGREPVLLGSLKSNIGHAQFAAGVAGVIKTVLALRHGLLPRTLHAQRPSPLVDWSSGALRLLTEARPWPETGQLRRAAVSSFGMSGTNAHVVLEQAPTDPEEAPAAAGTPRSRPSAAPLPASDGARDPDGTDRAPVPFLLSGVGERALRGQAARLRAHLADHPDAALRDVAFSLAGSRAALENRAVVVAGDRGDLLGRLDAVAQGQPAPGTVRSTVASHDGVVFVFPGQGAQWPGMGLELFEASAVFAARLTECADALRPFTGWHLLDVLRGQPDAPSLDDTDVVQPALFAVMVSLAELWRSLGVEPSAVVGHSQGEIAAACVAGALSLDDAARLVAVRSEVLLALAGRGAMASVFLPLPRVEELLRRGDGRVVVAAVNGPASVVVSGDADAVADLLARCAADGVRTRRVPVDIASHSAHVEAVRERLASALAPVAPRAERVPIYSATRAGPVDGRGLDADYWYENLRRPVRFEAAVRRLLEDGHQVFVEVSAHPVLAVGIEETLEDCSASGTVAGTLRRDEGGLTRLLLSAGELWTAGTPVDWRPVLRGGRPVELPTYAFQTKRYWLDPTRPTHRSGPAGTGAGTPGADTAESQFWAAVDNGDPEALASHLGPGAGAPQAVAEALAPAVPLLSAWRRRYRDRSRVQGWHYDVVWRPWAPPAGGPITGSWLLLSTEGVPGADLARQIAQAVRERGGHIVPLEVPDGTGREELAALVRRSADAADGRPFGVLSLLGTTEGAPAGHLAAPDGPALTLALLRALGDAQVGAPLWTVTQGAVSAAPGDPAACPGQAAVWGLARTAALEMPERWGGLVDLPPTVTGADAARLCDVLAADTRIPGAEGEDQVALRPGGALVRRLVRAVPPDAAERTPWRPRGTVLLTGATGVIGRHLVRWLAGGGADHIVCTSRSGGMPDSLAGVEEEPALSGTRLDVVACDVADRAAVQALVDAVEARSGPIRAVVHAAASIWLCPVQETTPRQLADAMAAKSVGARILDDVFATRNLDAFVLFSSIAGVWGSGQHGAYAAANAYLDALAQRRRERGLRALSVAWGLWEATEYWGAGGPPPPVLTAERQGLPVMRPELAVSALQQALDRDRTFAVVVDVAWDRFLPRFSSARRRPLLDEIAPDVPVPGRAGETGDAGDGDGTEQDAWRTALAGLPPAERERRLLDLVHSTTAAVLGHGTTAAVATGRPLRELGLDSLTSVELRNRLNTATGLRLPTAVVFEYPTVTALARRLAEDLAGEEPEQPSASAPPAETDPAPRGDTDPVVIVSMSCRLPGAVHSPEDLWDVLTAGTDAITALPADRGWDVEDVYDPEGGRTGTTYTRQGGFLDDAAGFDPGFFDITEAEALVMDPQQRLLLEASWEVLERAGIDASTLRGSRTGVYVGSRHQGYGAGVERPEGWLPHFGAGDLTSMLSGRVSYVLGLEGPAVTVDTACSSSMVALHLAAQALRQGECSLALAGGVTVMAGPSELIGLSGLGELSPDGRCRSFSADADGMGMAEGVALVLLERLSDARRHGHPVLAVVRGSAVNQDGASNGLASPNGAAQRKVIRQALASAGLSAGDVDAVEAHGTGTPLGDAIEAQVLLEVYGADRPTGQPLHLGTLKSNIGHTQSASGVTGVLKMVLAMRHGVLPRTLYAERPSAQVDWSGGVALLTEERRWPDTGRPRRAGVSSFGMSGTNTHVVLEEPGPAEPPLPPPEATAAGPRPGPVPWLVSARTPRALAAQAGRLAAFVESAPDARAEDIGLSLAAGRTALEYRAVVLALDLDGFRKALDALAQGRPEPDVVTGPKTEAPPAAVEFSDGDRRSPDAAAVRDLMAWSPAFADAMRSCDDAFAEVCGERLLDGDRAGLRDGPDAGTVAFAADVSAAALWRSFGVHPRGPAGDGLVARCLDGRLALADAVRTLADGSAPPFAGRGPARDGAALLEAPLRVADRQDFLRAAAGLWVRGVPVDFRSALRGGRRAPLPTYAFQRRRYWLGG